MTSVDLQQIIGYRDGEYLSVSVGNAGGFRSVVLPYRPGIGGEIVETLRQPGNNVYFGVNPVGPKATGRGTVGDVTRLAGLYCDLDVKPGGCPSIEVARSIVGELSAMLGTAPSAIVMSGHGLQPYWPIEDAPISAGDGSGRGKAIALTRRWGRLVAHVAKSHGAQVDSVYDLARVLRAPGSVNHKGSPVEVTIERGTGGPVTLAQIVDCLDEQGVSEQPGDVTIKSGAADYSAPTEWTFAEGNCGYSVTMRRGWMKDTPGARHPWLLAQAVRVAAAHRNGCMNADGLRQAWVELEQRFTELCEGSPTDPRKVKPLEMAEAISYAQRRAGAMDAAHMATELGGHLHDDQLVGRRVKDRRTVPTVEWPTPSVDPSTAPVPAKTAAAGTAVVDPAEHSGQMRMALRLAAIYGSELMFVSGIGWHHWEGARWRYDDQGHARRAVYDVLGRAIVEALDNADKDLRADARKCESASGVAGVLELASALIPFAVTVRDLDADPYLLNAANGTLDLRTGDLRSHDARDRITMVTRAAYDPAAISTTLTAFLARVLPAAEVREYLQRLIGVALLGKVVEHVLAILVGVGGNGKGTLYGALLSALGDYGSTAEPDLFMHRQGAHPTGEMDLRGKRLVVVSESEQDRRLAEATMKRLTGGDVIRARRMRENFVEFRPSHTPLLITNHLPKVSGDDPAIWRRLRVIPFDVLIADADKDVHLDEKLQLEADAVLAWAVAGWTQYRERGLDEPPAVVVATGDYRRSSDAVGRFIAERCLTSSPAIKATTVPLFAAWELWRGMDGAEQISQKAFGLALDRHGYPVTDKARDGRWREGIALAPVELEVGA